MTWNLLISYQIYGLNTFFGDRSDYHLYNLFIF